MAERETETDEPAGSGILDEWISRQELGAQLGVSVDTLARWETRRIGPPCVRIGRRVIYRVQAVREWLVRQEARTAGSRR